MNFSPPALHLPNDSRDSGGEIVLRGSGLSQSSFHFNEIDLIIHGKSSNLNLGSPEPSQSDAILYRIWRVRASTSDVMSFDDKSFVTLADIPLRVCKADISDDSLGDIVTLRVQKNTTTSKFPLIFSLDRKISSRRAQAPPRGRKLENIYQRSEGNNTALGNLCHIVFVKLILALYLINFLSYCRIDNHSSVFFAFLCRKVMLERVCRTFFGFNRSTFVASIEAFFWLQLKRSLKENLGH